MGVPEDSPLRDPGQIPFPSSTAAAQNPPVPIDEEETASMRVLVEQIDAHVEPNETEATSIPSAQDQPGGDLHSPVANQQQTDATDQTRPSVPSTYLLNRLFNAFISFYCLLILISFLVNLPMSPSYGD